MVGAGENVSPNFCVLIWAVGPNVPFCVSGSGVKSGLLPTGTVGAAIGDASPVVVWAVTTAGSSKKATKAQFLTKERGEEIMIYNGSDSR